MREQFASMQELYPKRRLLGCRAGGLALRIGPRTETFKCSYSAAPSRVEIGPALNEIALGQKCLVQTDLVTVYAAMGYPLLPSPLGICSRLHWEIGNRDAV